MLGWKDPGNKLEGDDLIKLSNQGYKVIMRALKSSSALFGAVIKITGPFLGKASVDLESVMPGMFVPGNSPSRKEVISELRVNVKPSSNFDEWWRSQADQKSVQLSVDVVKTEYPLLWDEGLGWDNVTRVNYVVLMIGHRHPQKVRDLFTELGLYGSSWGTLVKVLKPLSEYVSKFPKLMLGELAGDFPMFMSLSSIVGYNMGGIVEDSPYASLDERIDEAVSSSKPRFGFGGISFSDRISESFRRVNVGKERGWKDWSEFWELGVWKTDGSLRGVKVNKMRVTKSLLGEIFTPEEMEDEAGSLRRQEVKAVTKPEQAADRTVYSVPYQSFLDRRFARTATFKKEINTPGGKDGTQIAKMYKVWMEGSGWMFPGDWSGFDKSVHKSSIVSWLRHNSIGSTTMWEDWARDVQIVSVPGDKTFAWNSGLLSGFFFTSDFGTALNSVTVEMASDHSAELSNRPSGVTDITTMGDDLMCLSETFEQAICVRIVLASLGVVFRDSSFAISNGRTEFLRRMLIRGKGLYEQVARTIPSVTQTKPGTSPSLDDRERAGKIATGINGLVSRGYTRKGARIIERWLVLYTRLRELPRALLRGHSRLGGLGMSDQLVGWKVEGGEDRNVDKYEIGWFWSKWKARKLEQRFDSPVSWRKLAASVVGGIEDVDVAREERRSLHNRLRDAVLTFSDHSVGPGFSGINMSIDSPFDEIFKIPHVDGEIVSAIGGGIKWTAIYNSVESEILRVGATWLRKMLGRRGAWDVLVSGFPFGRFDPGITPLGADVLRAVAGHYIWISHASGLRNMNMREFVMYCTYVRRYFERYYNAGWLSPYYKE